MIDDERNALGALASSDQFRLALSYNDALDRCTQTGGENIEEVMAFFADDAMRIVTGLGDGNQVTTEIGKAAIRESFLRRSARLLARATARPRRAPPGFDEIHLILHNRSGGSSSRARTSWSVTRRTSSCESAHSSELTISRS
jgi:hypothetical protein